MYSRRKEYLTWAVCKWPERKEWVQLGWMSPSITHSLSAEHAHSDQTERKSVASESKLGATGQRSQSAIGELTNKSKRFIPLTDRLLYLTEKQADWSPFYLIIKPFLFHKKLIPYSKMLEDSWCFCLKSPLIKTNPHTELYIQWLIIRKHGIAAVWHHVC